MNGARLHLVPSTDHSDHVTKIKRGVDGDVIDVDFFISEFSAYAQDLLASGNALHVGPLAMALIDTYVRGVTEERARSKRPLIPVPE